MKERPVIGEGKKKKRKHRGQKNPKSECSREKKQHCSDKENISGFSFRTGL